MKNLHKLGKAQKPFSNMVVKHDMSKNDREQDKALQKEAKQRSADNSEDSNFLYVVQGPPGTRKIIKVKKRAMRTQKKK